MMGGYQWIRTVSVETCVNVALFLSGDSEARKYVLHTLKDGKINDLLFILHTLKVFDDKEVLLAMIELVNDKRNAFPQYAGAEVDNAYYRVCDLAITFLIIRLKVNVDFELGIVNK